MSKVVKLPQYKWSDNEREVEYRLPDDWDVNVYSFAGADRPAMTGEQVRAALTSPIGSPRLRELARGKKKVVIIFEDLTRPGRLYRVLPYVLKELEEGGIGDDQIQFICANGAHQGWNLIDFSRKLGADVVARYPVFNHFPFINYTPLGKTSYGGRVEVNTEVMSCDLKIALGGILPHGNMGFGGGGKIIMPGVSSFDAIYEHHYATHKAFKEQRRQSGFVNNRGFAEDNPLTLEAIEQAKIAGLDFLINILQDKWGEPVAIFAGAVEPTYWAAVKAAKYHYFFLCPNDNDIVIANSFAKSNEATGSLRFGIEYVRPRGGSLVLITNIASGQVVHYISSPLGKDIGSRNHLRMSIPANVKRLIIYSEFTEASFLETFQELDKARVSYHDNWDDVVLALRNRHAAGAKVAVLTDVFQ